MITLRLHDEELSIIMIALSTLTMTITACRDLDRREIAGLADKLLAIDKQHEQGKQPAALLDADGRDTGILDAYEKQLRKLH